MRIGCVILLERIAEVVCGLNNTGKNSGNQVVNRFSDHTKKAEAVFDLCHKILFPHKPTLKY
jgi:hypothetical protein